MTLKLQFVVEAIDHATAKVREVNRAVEKSREPWLKVRASARDFFNEAGWGKLQKQMDVVRQRGAGIVGWGRQAAGVLLGMGAAAGASFFGFQRVADGVDRINDAAQGLGVSAQRLQEIGFAAKMNGSSLDEVAQSLMFMNKNMAEARSGNKEMVQWMARAGITAADLKNKNFSAVDGFERMSNTFERVGDKGNNAQLKIAVSTNLLGRQGFKMIQLMNGGTAALRTFYAEAHRTGAVLSDETIKAMADFNDSMDKTKLTVFGAVATALAPAAKLLGQVGQRVVEWTAANRGLINTKVEEFIKRVELGLPGFISGVGQVVDAVGKIAGVANSAANAVGGWGNALKIVGLLIAAKFIIDLGLLVAAVATALPTLAGLTAVLWGIAAGFTAAMAWPLLFAAVLGGAAYIIWDQWTPISEFFTGLWDKVKRITSAVGGAFGFGAGAAAGPAAAAGGSAIPAGGMQKVGGTLRIYFDDKGRPRVDTLKKTPGSLLDMTVDTGPAMSGAY